MTDQPTTSSGVRSAARPRATVTHASTASKPHERRLHRQADSQRRLEGHRRARPAPIFLIEPGRRVEPGDPGNPTEVQDRCTVRRAVLGIPERYRPSSSARVRSAEGQVRSGRPSEPAGRPIRRAALARATARPDAWPASEEVQANRSSRPTVGDRRRRARGSTTRRPEVDGAHASSVGRRARMAGHLRRGTSRPTAPAGSTEPRARSRNRATDQVPGGRRPSARSRIARSRPAIEPGDQEDRPHSGRRSCAGCSSILGVLGG